MSSVFVLGRYCLPCTGAGFAVLLVHFDITTIAVEVAALRCTRRVFSV